MLDMVLSLIVVRGWQHHQAPWQQELCGQEQEGGLRSRAPWVVPADSHCAFSVSPTSLSVSHPPTCQALQPAPSSLCSLWAPVLCSNRVHFIVGPPISAPVRSIVSTLMCHQQCWHHTDLCSVLLPVSQGLSPSTCEVLRPCDGTRDQVCELQNQGSE